MRDLSCSRVREETIPLGTGTRSLSKILYTTSSIYGDDTLVYEDWSTPISLGDISSRKVSDSVTPHFEARRDAGEIVMNDFESLKTICLGGQDVNFLATQFKSTSDGTLTYEWSGSFMLDEVMPQGFENPYIPVAIPDEETSVDYDAAVALTKLHAKLGKSPADLLVSYVEFNKSVRSLNRLFRTAWSLLKKSKNIRQLFLKGSITVAQAASAYLEIRYGLRPIMYEIIGTIEAIEQLGKTKRTRYFTAANAVEDVEEVTFDRNVYNSVHFTASCYQKQTYTRQITAGAVVEYRFSSTSSVVDSFGFDELVRAGWELVPFSFIVDWFINVGDFLASWTPNYDYIVKGSWIKVLETYAVTSMVTNFRIESTENPAPGADAYSLTSQPATSTLYRVRRYANPSVPRFPRFNVKLNGLKIGDLLAILYGFRKDLKW